LEVGVEGAEGEERDGEPAEESESPHAPEEVLLLEARAHDVALLRARASAGAGQHPARAAHQRTGLPERVRQFRLHRRTTPQRRRRRHTASGAPVWSTAKWGPCRRPAVVDGGRTTVWKSRGSSISGVTAELPSS